MHNLIVGASYSGKTNLCKRFAYDFDKAKKRVIVFDPTRSNGWPVNAQKFSEPEPFLDFIDSAQSAYVFIDEAKTLWNHDLKRADAILYQKRHQGLLIFVIGQRAEGMIPPNARNQCGKVFAFKQSRKDSDTLAKEYDEKLSECIDLKKGHFIMSDGFASAEAKLDYSKGIPPFINRSI